MLEKIKKIRYRLENDIRLVNIEGTLISYSRKEYIHLFNNDRYYEIEEKGYKLSILKQNAFEKTIYIWNNNVDNNIYLKDSTSKEILNFDIKQENLIIENIINIIFKEELKGGIIYENDKEKFNNVN